MSEKQVQVNQEAPSSASSVRRPYLRPDLTEFGSVHVLTRGTTGSNIDNGGAPPNPRKG